MPRGGNQGNSQRPQRQSRQGGQQNVIQRKAQRTWSTKETTTILEYLKDTVSRGFEIEKPKAPIYYKHFLQRNRASEDEEDHLAPEITVPMIITHVNNVKKSYKAAFTWSNQTGQGVKDNMGDETFRALLLKKCRYYDLSEEVWGHRTNIKIPVVQETNQVGPSTPCRPENRSGLEDNDNDDDDDFHLPSLPSRPVSRSRSRSPFQLTPGSPRSRDGSEPRTTRPETPVRPVGGSYSRPRPRTSGAGHPGRKLDKAGEKLSKSFYQKGPKETYEDMVCQREANEGHRLKIQQEQLKLQQQQVNNESHRLDEELELKRQQFEYTKVKDSQALELEREVTRRQALRVEEMKLKLELAKIGILTNTD